MKRTYALSVACLILAVGCEATPVAEINPLARAVAPRLTRKERAVVAHAAIQTHYAETGSDEALFWLLFNGVRSGMDRRGIEEVLGTEIEPTEPTDGFQSPFGIQEEDAFYETGPTQQGWMCLFHFREGKLVNYHTLPPAQSRPAADAGGDTASDEDAKEVQQPEPPYALQ